MSTSAQSGSPMVKIAMAGLGTLAVGYLAYKYLFGSEGTDEKVT